MKNLLVVIDMVNGFVNFGALADKKINNITGNIIKIMKELKDKKFDMLAFKDCHTENDKEFEIFPKHCVKGTEESELIPELKAIENQFDYIVEKNTTNGFNAKEFRKLLKTNNYDDVVVCGCCTDICVSDFVKSYLAFTKFNHLKTRIFVVNDACATFDAPNHNAEICHKDAINKMKKAGAIIVDYQSKNAEKTL